MDSEVRNMESEIRSVKGELRAKSNFVLEGVAARYGTRSHDLGGFVETIAPGAFKRSLEAGHKVVVTLNHDPNQVLGSTKSGTAKVFDSPEGLRFQVKLDPSNTIHSNCYASVKRGDIDSCSFAFRVPAGGDSFSQTKDAKGKPIPLRTLKDVDLVDVSAVTYPAYPEGTQVDARSLKAHGLLKVAARSNAPGVKKPIPAFQLTDEMCARMNGQTLAEYHRRKEMNHRSVRLTRCAENAPVIAAQTDADLRARADAAAKVIANDSEQEKRDAELRERMEIAAGRTCRSCHIFG